MIKAVIITAPGFQDEEYVYPYYRLKEAGYEVEVATKDGADRHGQVWRAGACDDEHDGTRCRPV